MTKWINEVEFVCFPHYVVPAVPVEVKTAAGLSGLWFPHLVLISERISGDNLRLPSCLAVQRNNWKKEK